MEQIIQEIISITEIPTAVLAVLGGTAMLLVQVLKNIWVEAERYGIALSWLFAVILSMLITPASTSDSLYILTVLITSYIISTTASGTYSQIKSLTNPDPKEVLLQILKDAPIDDRSATSPREVLVDLLGEALNQWYKQRGSFILLSTCCA